MEHEIGEAEKPPEFLNEKDNAIDKRSCGAYEFQNTDHKN